MFKFLRNKKCEQCTGLKQTVLVENPNEFSSLIKRIKAEVANGNLFSLPPENDGFQEEFDLVPNNAPWSDIVLNYFKCSNCNASFKLFADTYHGSKKNGWYCCK